MAWDNAAMRFWFSRDSQIPIREQLVTQVILGILGNELAPGSRLPSTRDLARRFRLHANTVSAAYRELERDQWVELRHGSGVYVCSSRPANAPTPALALDHLIVGLFRSARDLGAPLSVVRSRLRHWLEVQPPDHIVLIEPDPELRAIVAAEIGAAVSIRVESAGMDILRTPEKLSGAIVATMPGSDQKVRKLLPETCECLSLRVNSATTSLAQWMPARTELLIGIASGWPRFLKLAQTMLVASGIDSDALVIRDAHKAGWKNSLRGTVAVVCDSLTASKLPPATRALVYRLLSDAAIADLQRYQGFVSAPTD
jgi:DNA-binding transcriptional regulator YhcF (GntR family)